MKLSASTPVSCGEDTLSTTLAYTESYVALAFTDNSVHVFSSVDGSHRWTFADPCGIVWALALAGDALVVGSVDGSLRAYELLEGTLLHIIAELFSADTDTQGTSRRINFFCIPEPDANPLSVLAATGEGIIRLWNLRTQNCERTFKGGHNGYIFSMQVCGAKLVSAAYEGTVCAWNFADGNTLWKAPADGQVFGLAVGDGKVAVGRRDGGIKILGLEDGAQLAAFNGHSKIVNGLIFYRNLLVSTGTDGWAKVWSMESYQLERNMRLHDHAIVTRGMLGPWLVTGGKDGGGEEDVCGLDCSVRRWKVDGQDAATVNDIGPPAVVVWGLVCLNDRIVVSLMKRGKPTVEIWDDSSSA